MKQNRKFLLMYIAILFSFALILIVFAGLTQNNYRKEIEQQASESAGVKKSLITLTEENQNLNDSNKKLTQELDTVGKEKATLERDKEVLSKAIGGDESVTQILLNAYSLFAGGDTQSAKDAISQLDRNSLTTAQTYIYNTIIGE